MTRTEFSKITVDIDGAAALVLFEMLARFDEDDELSIQDGAEKYALWLLQGALESRLAEPLAPDYDKRLDEARAELRNRFGEALD